MTENATKYEGALEAAQVAWGAICPRAETFPVDEIRSQLEGLMDDVVLDGFLEAVVTRGVEERSRANAAVTRGLSGRTRRQEGIYQTPRSLADVLAAPAALLENGDAALDLSCGAGALLMAAARRAPAARAVGVEKQISLAVAAAARLAALRRHQGVPCDDRIHVGDGLGEHEGLNEWMGEVGLVLGNPPYVREKGNRERFRALKHAHPNLEEYWAGRMDLQYLFFHRSLDYLRPGGWLAFVTSSYWLTATNARKLREDLLRRGRPRMLVEVRGAGVFEDAPGHHTLLSYVERDAGTSTVWTRSVASVEGIDADAVERGVRGAEPAATWERIDEGQLEAVSWVPFVDAETRAWGEGWGEHGTALEELLEDRQGFVSGADTVNAWNEKRLERPPVRGTPIFLFDRSPPRAFGRRQGTVVRPVVRGSRLRANAVLVTPPDDSFVLYLDGPFDEAEEEILEAQLGRFRPILERRREARTGAMPWYRLHWPRDRAEQSSPKLVAPRRSKKPCFALDLSGSSVSSDCTYLLAPDDVADPIRYLVVAMVLLNRPETERYLREFGKTKGEMMEFYSEPLRRLPLPVERRGGQLDLCEDLLGAERADAVSIAVQRILQDLR